MPTLMSMANRSQFTRGYTIALISAAILSTTAIFIRHLTQTYDLPPLVLAFWRDVMVVLTLLVALGFLRPRLLAIPRQHLCYLAGYGFVLAIFNALWTFSVALNGAAIATVLVYSSAAFTALLGWWFLQERLDWVKLLAIVFSLSGCILVSGALTEAIDSINLGGVVVGVLTGLAYAIYSLLGRAAAQRGLNSWTTLIVIFAFATVFLGLFILLPEGFLSGDETRLNDLFWLGDAWDGWGVLFLLAAGPTVAGFGLYIMSLSYLPSSVANLIATLEPAFTAVTAYFFLGERLTGIQIGGSLLILVGVGSLRIYENWALGRGDPGLPSA